MAIKPRSRAHEDRLQKLECRVGNWENTFKSFLQANGYGVEDIGKDSWIYSETPVKPRTFWQRLNAYLSR